jgi:hypothetical protein
MTEQSSQTEQLPTVTPEISPEKAAYVKEMLRNRTVAAKIAAKMAISDVEDMIEDGHEANFTTETVAEFAAGNMLDIVELVEFLDVTQGVWPEHTIEPDYFLPLIDAVLSECPWLVAGEDQING